MSETSVKNLEVMEAIAAGEFGFSAEELTGAVEFALKVSARLPPRRRSRSRWFAAITSATRPHGSTGRASGSGWKAVTSTTCTRSEKC